MRISPELLVRALHLPESTMITNCRMAFDGAYVELMIVGDHESLPDTIEGEPTKLVEAELSVLSTCRDGSGYIGTQFVRFKVVD